MTRRKGMLMVYAFVVAVVLNIMLFASAALLSRDRPIRQTSTAPISVKLVTLKPTAPPPPEEKHEIPKPKPKPEMDFTPELAQPSLRGPSPLDIQVRIDPSFFAGGPQRGEFIFNSGELDQPPRKKLSSKDPAYPFKAQQRDIEGYVRVKFLVRADGTVSEVSVLDDQPKGLFGAAVLKAVPLWKFQPGVIDGQSVPSWVITNIHFSLDD